MRKAAIVIAASAVACFFMFMPGCTKTTSFEKVEQVQIVKGPWFGNNAAADKRRGFFDAWNEQIIRENKAVGTVFIGDSITEIWDLYVYFTPGDGLLENRGIVSDLASNMVKRFEADVIQLHPRNVVILAGTNDVGDLLAARKSDEEIVGTVATSVEAMMDQARAARINTLVCSILPTNSDYKRHADRSWLRAKINERLKSACIAKGCVYVEYAAPLSEANGDLRKDLARDGLHPHAAGYRIMARVLKEAAAAHRLRL